MFRASLNNLKNNNSKLECELQYNINVKPIDDITNITSELSTQSGCLSDDLASYLGDVGFVVQMLPKKSY